MAITRRSRKRDAMLSLLRSTTCHPSADWVYRHMRADFPDLSLGTVYRNLNQLKDEGAILSVGVIDGQERYDGNVSPHAHFVCEHCGAVLDVALPDDPATDRLAAGMLGARVDGHELKFHGVCAACLESEGQ